MDKPAHSRGHKSPRTSSCPSHGSPLVQVVPGDHHYLTQTPSHEQILRHFRHHGSNNRHHIQHQEHKAGEQAGYQTPPAPSQAMPFCIRHSLCSCRPTYFVPSPSARSSGVARQVVVTERGDRHLEHRQDWNKSVPSSPSSRIHDERGDRQSRSSAHSFRSNKNCYSPAVVKVVAKANKAKQKTSHSQHMAHGAKRSPIDSGEASGCCGGRLERDIKKLGLSSSYSALDTLQSDQESYDGFPGGLKEDQNHQKAMSEYMKSFKHWITNVSDKVEKGTMALKEALPSLKEDHHVVMIGLDSAGKSTVLYRLKFDQFVNTTPTIGFNCEKVRGTMGRSRGLTFLVWDVGGQEKARPLWRAYTRATDGIIFVVDSCDKERLEEARLELHRIMSTPDNATTPLLVIANKQDLPDATGPEELKSILNLSDLRQLHHLEPVCAVNGEGLDEGLEKLYHLIIKRRKMNKRLRNKTR